MTYGVNYATTCIRADIDIILKVDGDVHIRLLDDKDRSSQISCLSLLRNSKFIDVGTNEEHIS